MFKKMFHYHEKSREFVIHLYWLKHYRYLVVKINFWGWALPLRIQRFVWSINRNVEWFVWFLCFGFELNNYGALVRGERWPKGWL